MEVRLRVGSRMLINKVKIRHIATVLKESVPILFLDILFLIKLLQCIESEPGYAYLCIGI